MKNARSKIMSAALLSANVLTLAEPAIVHAAGQPSVSTQSSIVQSEKEDKNKNTDDTKTVKSDDSSVADTKKDDKKTYSDNPQSLKEQTMVIQKVIATNENDLNSDSLKGVNGSKFTVYDVTDLMNTIIKEKLKVDDSQPSDKTIDTALDKANENTKQEASVKSESSESGSSNKDDKSSSSASSTGEKTKDDSEEEDKSNEEDKLVKKVEQMRKDDTIRKEVANRATKLDPKSMKTFAQVTTEHDKTSNKDGVARVKVPIDGKYHAYYVVNTETPKEAMAKNSDPIVIITPITDKEGKYSPEFNVYPKSEKILPTTPEKSENKTPDNKSEDVSDAKMYRTGKVQPLGFWNNVTEYIKSFFD